MELYHITKEIVNPILCKAYHPDSPWHIMTLDNHPLVIRSAAHR